MRKLLAILLVSLLSLQASWAAAASYCRHEQDAAARHFGHHEHQHAHDKAGTQSMAGGADSIAVVEQALPAADTDAAGDAALAGAFAGADLDCGVCQWHAVSGLPPAPALSALDPPPSSGASLIQPAPSSAPAARPERPNWPSA